MFHISYSANKHPVTKFSPLIPIWQNAALSRILPAVNDNSDVSGAFFRIVARAWSSSVLPIAANGPQRRRYRHFSQHYMIYTAFMVVANSFRGRAITQASNVEKFVTGCMLDRKVTCSASSTRTLFCLKPQYYLKPFQIDLYKPSRKIFFRIYSLYKRSPRNASTKVSWRIPLSFFGGCFMWCFMYILVSGIPTSVVDVSER